MARRLSLLGQTGRALTIKPGGPRGPWMPLKPMSPGGPCGGAEEGLLCLGGRWVSEGLPQLRHPWGLANLCPPCQERPYLRGSSETNKYPQLLGRCQCASPVLNGISL